MGCTWRKKQRRVTRTLATKVLIGNVADLSLLHRRVIAGAVASVYGMQLIPANSSRGHQNIMLAGKLLPCTSDVDPVDHAPSNAALQVVRDHAVHRHHCEGEHALYISEVQPDGKPCRSNGSSEVRCANPACRQVAHDIFSGTLRLVELDVQPEERVSGDANGFPVCCVPSRYFWLCARCSETMKITGWRGGEAMLTVHSPAKKPPMLDPIISEPVHWTRIATEGRRPALVGKI